MGLGGARVGPEVVVGGARLGMERRQQFPSSLSVASVFGISVREIARRSSSGVRRVLKV